jgi:predicted peptidase
MRFPILLLLLSFLFQNAAVAQEGSYLKQEFTKDGHTLPYRILYPKNYTSKKKYPIVLLLHGAGERGNDNELQLIHGADLFLNHQDDFPAIVIIPQCPKDNYWSSAQINRNTTPLTISFDYPKNEIRWPLDAALSLVKHIAKKESVDKKRIYVTGLSMGGMGTFEAIAREPKLFAAAIPICGGGDTTSVSAYAKKIPVWIFHGAADGVVSVELSRQMHAALKSHGARVIYTEYPGVGHNSWSLAFAEPEYLPWLFGQKKGR